MLDFIPTHVVRIDDLEHDVIRWGNELLTQDEWDASLPARWTLTPDGVVLARGEPLEGATLEVVGPFEYTTAPHTTYAAEWVTLAASSPMPTDRWWPCLRAALRIGMTRGPLRLDARERDGSLRRPLRSDGDGYYLCVHSARGRVPLPMVARAPFLWIARLWRLAD
jgi:hypothetical protein